MPQTPQTLLSQLPLQLIQLDVLQTWRSQQLQQATVGLLTPLLLQQTQQHLLLQLLPTVTPSQPQLPAPAPMTLL